MKLLFENWRNYLVEEISSSKEVEQIGREEITINTLTAGGGKIVIWENSPWAQGVHSIQEFKVDEDKQGQGIGSQLVDAVIKEYSGEEISGQVSSLASLKVFYNKGFKSAEAPDATFEELVEVFNNEGGSLNMRITP
jgi:GNAT superfamily N-acetyltransferase